MTVSIPKILVANRGEIACRVMKSCKQLGIRTVAVYSHADAHAPHVSMADEAVCIGDSVPSLSYLDADKIIHACITTGAAAVHPGYGFLSENAEFANKCAKNNIVFIGPRPESILAIGDKISAKLLLSTRAPQVPLLPGYNGADQSIETLVKESLKIGFPVLLKASAGGGGKGMRVVRNAEQLKEEISGAQGEASRSFGDARLLVEKYIETARHIEVQIFGDSHGNVVALFERECSVQRRHQKIIEECPSPFLTKDLREKMTSSAVAIGSLISYVGAGTVEFIVDGATGKYYFLEVNTRLQVEHPVTEAVTGLDLVAFQIWVAQGGTLKAFLDKSGGVKMNGHAIEVRIYAEDPDNEFFPATGKISKWSLPKSGIAIRSDSGIVEGSEITNYYDPMISKLTIHAPTRIEAIDRMISILTDTCLLGLPAHNIEFLVQALRFKDFRTGAYDTNVVARMQKSISVDPMVSLKNLVTGCLGAALFGWSLKKKQALASNLPYRRVQSGFRNVPYKMQSVQFDVIKKPAGIEEDANALLVEYTVLPNYEGAADTQFRFRVSTLVPAPPKSKVQTPKATVVWDGEAALVKSQFDERGADWVNASIRFISDGVQKSLTVSAFDEKMFMHSPEWGGKFYVLGVADPYKSAQSGGGSKDGVLITPMPCRVISVNSTTGTSVKVGDTILTIESMKMETKIRATVAGIVTVTVKEGDMVKAGEVVAKIE
ncbi:hypothetical protein HDU78_007886 [Chytriomyces hyalinus]|nr:hypothetical protein HDU78_007886 [Chytriomyces hyalinus]